MPSPREVAVLVVDDDPYARHGLCRSLHFLGYVTVIACQNGKEAREHLAANPSIGIALIDVILGVESGIELAAQVRQAYPSLPVVLITAMQDGKVFHQAGRSGAQGLFDKLEPPAALGKAIAMVLDGGTYVSQFAAGEFVAADGSADHGARAALETLSDREREVFFLLGRGYRAMEIAQNLGLAASTIHTVYERIKEKLDVCDTTELLHLARRYVEDSLFIRPL